MSKNRKEAQSVQKMASAEASASETSFLIFSRVDLTASAVSSRKLRMNILCIKFKIKITKNWKEAEKDKVELLFVYPPVNIFFSLSFLTAKLKN